MAGKKAKRRAEKALEKKRKAAVVLRVPARRRVLDTTELLEAILLGLPVKTLLLAQRVSHGFKAVIDNSIHLQRALFFLPNTLTPPQLTPAREPTINPLFAASASRRTSILPLYMGDEDATYIHSAGIVQVNDGQTVTHTRGSQSMRETVGFQSFLDTRTLYLPTGYPSRAASKTKVYPSGSWRNMYLSQPPCTISWTADGEKCRLASAEVSNVLKMGEIWNEDHWLDSGSKSLLQFKVFMRREVRERRAQAKQNTETDPLILEAMKLSGVGSGIRLTGARTTRYFGGYYNEEDYAVSLLLALKEAGNW